MYRNRLEELKKEAKTSSCSRCFLEATNLFEKQVKLMRSLQIYEEREEEGNKIDISEIEPEKLVSEVCVTVPQTDTGRRVENTKGNGRTSVKELGKIAP